MRCTSSLVPLAAMLALGGALVFDTADGQSRAQPISAANAESPPPARSSADLPNSERQPPSDADLKTFAEIYAQLQEADTKFEHDMATARTVREARAVADARARASDAALTSHGWTRGKFDRVASAIDRDPALIERVMTLFEEDS